MRLTTGFPKTFFAATVIAAAIAWALPSAELTQPKHAPACPKSSDPIAIRSVSLSESPIFAGTTVSGTVLATCNVAAVTAQVGTYRIGVPKTSPGVFQTSVDVPHFVWPGHFNLVVTAVRSDGASVSTTIPIDIRW